VSPKGSVYFGFDALIADNIGIAAFGWRGRFIWGIRVPGKRVYSSLGVKHDSFYWKGFDFALIAGACWFGGLCESRAAVAQAEHSVATAAGEGARQEHTIPASAVEIGRIGSFPITNSMVVSWIVALGLIVFAQVSMRHVKTIPAGAQNFWSGWWRASTIFLKALSATNWSRKRFGFLQHFYFHSILQLAWSHPGVGTIGWGVKGEHGFHVSEPWFRGANADLNMTLAMAITSLLVGSSGPADEWSNRFPAPLVCAQR
jgi:hypothetical protein